ncbi:MAG: hypothetical protein JNJ54_19190 [Myxococcaceae bacterium]|nr:hypothetical protein [Myxococcaceae bacterium]
MRVLKGRVVGNTVVVDEVLPEGADVEVLVREAGEAFVLTDEMHRQLDAAAESIRAGRGVDAEAVLQRLEKM